MGNEYDNETESNNKLDTNEVIKKCLNNVKEKSDKLKENVSKQAAETPFKFVSTILLAGILIGYLMKRKA